ncbi:MAG: hypothetical protein FWE37_03010 [Spirochaetaceae bacterium]|nr:hypothetical protein [Spirochaetaceae bacterium]
MRNKKFYGLIVLVSLALLACRMDGEEELYSLNLAGSTFFSNTRNALGIPTQELRFEPNTVEWIRIGEDADSFDWELDNQIVTLISRGAEHKFILGYMNRILTEIDESGEIVTEEFDTYDAAGEPITVLRDISFVR